MRNITHFMLLALCTTNFVYSVEPGVTRDEYYRKMKTEWENSWMHNPSYSECKPDFTTARIVYRGGKYLASKYSKLVTPITWWVDAIIGRQSAWYCFHDSCIKDGKQPSLPELMTYLSTQQGTCDEYLDANFDYDCVKLEDWSLSSVNRCNQPCARPSKGLSNELRQYCDYGHGAW
jgi:hypothetical protein